MGGRGGRCGRPGVPANKSGRPPAPSPHLDHELREGVDGQGAAQRGAQTQQPHEPQHSHLLQLPARAPGALARLPFSQQLLQVTASPSPGHRHAGTCPRAHHTPGGGARSRHTGRLGVGGGPGLTSQLPPVPRPVAPPTEAPSPGTWPAPHLPTEPCCLQTAVPSPTRSHGTLPEGPTAGSKLRASLTRIPQQGPLTGRGSSRSPSSALTVLTCTPGLPGALGVRASWHSGGLFLPGPEDTGPSRRGSLSAGPRLVCPWTRGWRTTAPGARELPAHLQLGSDVVVLKADGPSLGHFVVPGTENGDGVDPRGAAHPVALPERAGHAGRSRARQGVRWGRRRRGRETQI